MLHPNQWLQVLYLLLELLSDSGKEGGFIVDYFIEFWA